ncbi:MAG: RelA/SpoT family protein [bacterium]|nr:RelA/SpoT family protein [bacterium]
MPKQTLEEILKNYPEAKDRELISRAFEFAKNAHLGQKRLSGQDYIIHPARTALILSHLKLDAGAVAAGLLHDVLDDTKVSPQELEQRFGGEIAFLVKGVSRLGKIRLPRQKLEIGPIEKRAKRLVGLEIENLRRMFFAMTEDIRVIIIKLADRVHNMETLEFIPKEKQQRIALETMEIFAPLANRLGIQTIKTKLENLAFPYLYLKEYQWLLENSEERYSEARKYLEKTRTVLEKYLEQEKIPFIKTQGRLKSRFSLYQKLLKHGMNFDRIYDLAALRIIVKDAKTCYEVLGAIHKYWRPLPGRIKDYIAFPKPNGYQSLHTTVFCQEGKIIEVQIRTAEMHKTAERGVCAHWARKEGVDLKRKGKAFAWIEELANWQKENPISREYLNELKIDFFKNRIFIFTPKGDIIDLPEGACPIDFAYAVHSEIGNHCVGAKVNGKMLPLSGQLRNGDVVEILIDKNRGPSRDWLKVVKTGLAKSHIKKQIEPNFFAGLRQRFLRMRDLRKPVKEIIPSEKIRPVVKKDSVTVGGKSGVAHFAAKCCQPRAGDKVTAYLTKTRGAAIHRSDCRNLKKLKTRWPEKILEAEWK